MTSFLALKGFQDSNLPVHVDEYFNFHLGVRCRCPRPRHLSSSLSCKFRKAFCIWNESQWMLVKHKQTIKRASGATPAHSFSLCQTPMHSLIRSPRMPSHASHSQNVSHSEISLHSISIAHIPVITLYRDVYRNRHRNYLIVVNNKFKLPYSIKSKWESTEQVRVRMKNVCDDEMEYTRNGKLGCQLSNAVCTKYPYVCRSQQANNWRKMPPYGKGLRSLTQTNTHTLTVLYT